MNCFAEYYIRWMRYPAKHAYGGAIGALYCR